jgi:hypothetical protein
MRLAQKGYMSFIESQREQGRLRSVIKSILGANAGKRHTDSIPLEVAMTSTGRVITDPAELHKECTKHYITHHELPSEHANELHLAEDWLPYIQDKHKFLNVFCDSSIPTWCLDIVHHALQEKPQAEAVRAQLMQTLLVPPTLEEFKKSIRKSKTNSAPGMSGLSYNMLKSFPRDMVEYVYRLWIHFWNKPDTDLPKSWKWRWLHQLPKCIQELMGFSDYRPLMLCEVLRKLWSNSVIIRIVIKLWRLISNSE